MISNPQFWRTWPRTLQILTFLIFGLILSVTFALLYWYLKNPANLLSWDVPTELHKKFISRELFSENGLRFAGNELVYYVKEWFLPSSPSLQLLPAYLLLACFFTGVSLIASGLSYQNGFWFLAAIISIAGLLLSFRLEVTFQQTSSLPFLLAFLAAGGALLGFNSFFKQATYLLRLASFLGLSFVLVALAVSSGKLNFPAYALAQYSVIFGVVVFAIYLFLIAHEGMALVVKAVSGASEKGKSSLPSFLLLSGFYLVNCLLIYLENIRLFENEAFVIDPIWLFFISSVLGLFGFRKLTDSLEWYSFRQTGFWIYSGLWLISVSVFAFAYATGNDPLYELLNDYIAICHLAVGAVFFVHVLVNFTGVFRQGLPVDRVLYQPRLSRLLLARTAAVALVGFLLIQKNIYSYNQLQAALNNALGDFYLKEGENTAAESFYKESIQYDPYNHKANYSLGNMARLVGDGATAAYYFKLANQKNPTEFSYAALSRHFEQEDLYFDALFNLREGLSKFPESPYLLTNMAFLLEKAGATDSVFYYLSKASDHCSDCVTENANMLAFWIENARPEKLDSVTSPYLGYSSASLSANTSAVQRMLPTSSDLKAGIPLKKKDLSPAEFSVLYNQKMLVSGEAWPDSVWNSLTDELTGAGLAEDVLFLKAHETYMYSDKMKAVKQLTYLAQDSTEAGLMYRRTLGLWYLKEGLYEYSIQWLLASGDAESANLMDLNGFKEHLQSRQKQQAEELMQQEITLKNYVDLQAKAPFNPYLAGGIADFLEKNKKYNEAYNLVFDALEFNETSALLWKKQVMLALKNGVTDYAAMGMTKLSTLLSAEEFRLFEQQVNQEKQRLAALRSEF